MELFVVLHLKSLGFFAMIRFLGLVRWSTQGLPVSWPGSQSTTFAFDAYIGCDIFFVRHGTRNAQPASILSLLTLFKASPDDSEQLVADSLPALRAILEDDQRSEAVYTNALTLLWTISQKYSHSTIIQCGIVPSIVVRLRQVAHVNTSTVIIDELPS